MPENENAALKAAVEELKTSNKQETKAGDYIVIKVTGPSPKDIRFFAYDELEKLGAGTFSVVYKAYPVDASTGKLGATQKEIRALKKLRDTYQTTSKDEIRDEVEIFYKHYPRVKPEVHVINNYSHIFTEAFEGGNLIDYKDGKAVLNPSIQALNLSERFQLAFQLAVGFNLFHHNTPTTGAAIILGDIKPANVIIKVVKPAKEGAEQFRPVAQPSLRASLEFHTPIDFGPDLAGFHLLGGWAINMIYTWQSGAYETFLPRGPDETNNVQWVDYSNMNLRIRKQIRKIFGTQPELYISITNLFDQKYLNRGAFNDSEWLEYMNSLKLPMFEGDRNGSDRIGIYPEDGKSEHVNVNINPLKNWQLFLWPRDIYIGARIYF